MGKENEGLSTAGSSASTSRFAKRSYDQFAERRLGQLMSRPARPAYNAPRHAPRDEGTEIAEAQIRENFGRPHQEIFRNATERLDNLPSTYNTVRPQLDRALGASAATQAAPYFGNALTGVSGKVGEQLKGYSNPISQDEINNYLGNYDRTMSNMSQKAIQHWNENTLPAIQDSAIGHGNFGGGAHAYALARASRDAQKAFLSELGQRTDEAHHRAYGFAQADRERQLGAANAVGQFGGQDIAHQVQAGQSLGQIAGADTERQLNATNIGATALGRDNLMTAEAARSKAQMNNEHMTSNRENAEAQHRIGLQNEERTEKGLKTQHDDFVRQHEEPYENVRKALETGNLLPRDTFAESTVAPEPAESESIWKTGAGLFQTLAGMGASQSPSSSSSSSSAPLTNVAGYSPQQPYKAPDLPPAPIPLGGPAPRAPQNLYSGQPAAHGGSMRALKFARGGQVQYFADGGMPTGTNQPMEMLPQYSIPENPDELLFQQQSREHQQRLRNPNPNQAFSEGLIKSGLGMLASKNPSTIGSFAEGASQGFDHYLGKKKEEASDMEKALNIQKLLGDTKRIQAREEHERMMKEEKRKIEKGYLDETVTNNKAKTKHDKDKLDQDLKIAKMDDKTKRETATNKTGEKLNPFQTAKLKEDAKYLSKLRDKTNTITQRLGLLDEIDDLIDKSGRVGPVAGNEEGYIGQFNKLTGSDNRQTAGKAIDALIGLRAGEMPGSNQNAKIKQARAELPGLDKSIETNRRIITRTKASLQREKQKIEFLDDYASVGVPVHLALKAFDKWSDANPIVDKKHKLIKPKGSPKDYLKQMMKDGALEEPVVEEEVVVEAPEMDARKEAAMKILEMRRAKSKKVA